MFSWYFLNGFFFWTVCFPDIELLSDDFFLLKEKPRGDAEKYYVFYYLGDEIFFRRLYLTFLLQFLELIN